MILRGTGTRVARTGGTQTTSKSEGRAYEETSRTSDPRSDWNLEVWAAVKAVQVLSPGGILVCISLCSAESEAQPCTSLAELAI